MAALTNDALTADLGDLTCLWHGPFSIRPGRAGNTPVAGYPPTVSTADGHGMILIERRVVVGDATYRVA